MQNSGRVLGYKVQRRRYARQHFYVLYSNYPEDIKLYHTVNVSSCPIVLLNALILWGVTLTPKRNPEIPDIYIQWYNPIRRHRLMLF